MVMRNLEGHMFDEEMLTCKKCGEIAIPNYKYVDSNNSIQARCSGCGAFIKNVKHTTTVAVPEQDGIPTINQTRYIKSFYSSNRVPKSKNLATELIYVLEKVRREYEL